VNALPSGRQHSGPHDVGACQRQPKTDQLSAALWSVFSCRRQCPGDRAFGVRDRRRAPIELQLASLNTRRPKRNRPSCRVAVYRPRKRKTDQSGKQPIQQVRPSLKRPYPTTDPAQRSATVLKKSDSTRAVSNPAMRSPQTAVGSPGVLIGFPWQTGRCTPTVHSQSVGSSLIRRRSRRR
jgi:hypothetical protein